MTKFYSTFSAIIFITLLFPGAAFGQCPEGQIGGSTMYDTTIAFPTGVTNRQIKFPKFDPTTGMLSCVRLRVTITGIIDTVAMQNYSASPQSADFYYNRTDQMTGPGLTPSLQNSFSGHYGTYGLAAYDGSPNTGPDFKSLGRDTVLRQTMTRTLTDSTTISSFYGTDSVVYNYSINVSTSAAITGGSSSSLVLTSAFVNFRFEYCTCPIHTLPVGLINFRVTKSGTDEAMLRWEAEKSNDWYVYDVEVSRDGKAFTAYDEVEKAEGLRRTAYRYTYVRPEGENGTFYFRLRQRWPNGYYRYSEIRTVQFAPASTAQIVPYPNPSQGVVGLKFINARPGSYRVHISNAGGQTVLSKDLQVAEVDYKPLGSLPKGNYYLRVTEAATSTYVVHHLVVQ